VNTCESAMLTAEQIEKLGAKIQDYSLVMGAVGVLGTATPIVGETGGDCVVRFVRI